MRLFLALPFLVFTLTIAFPLQAETFRFSAPPRESEEEARRLYEPVARFLTETTGARFEYVFPGSWLAYQGALADDRFDLVFDGPHFVAWRMVRHDHVPLVRIPGRLQFVVVARKDSGLERLEDIAGHRICGHPPPHLATLSLLALQDNPVRQPKIKEKPNFGMQFRALVAGECEAMVLPKRLVGKFLTPELPVRVIAELPPFAHQAITAGTRLSPELREQVRQALLSDAGQRAMQAMRERYARGKPLIPARPEDYGLATAHLLEPVWFFSSSNPRHTRKLDEAYRMLRAQAAAESP